MHSWPRQTPKKKIVGAKAKGKRQITLPSYLFLEKTSGAIYAGVPTVDFGWECNTDDWKQGRQISNQSYILEYKMVCEVVRSLPLSSQNHIF